MNPASLVPGCVENLTERLPEAKSAITGRQLRGLDQTTGFEIK